MIRTFTIFDSRGYRQFADSDLPLAIGGRESDHIFVDNEGIEDDIAGYISDAQGHLFFQPAAANTAIFHNNRRIAESVWIKSGDITRIGSNIVQHSISGDWVEIRVSPAVEAEPVLPETGLSGALPPGREIPEMPLPETVKKLRLRKGLITASAFLFLTLLFAVYFVLASRPLEIEVKPDPDSIAVSGFPPVIKIGSRFLGLKGKYALKIEKQGYQTLETPVAIVLNKTANRYSYTLEKMAGKVSFLTEPAKAQVFINGEMTGETPLHDRNLPAGEHPVRITKDRYLDLEQNITVEGKGQEQRFDFVLSPAWSTVTLTSEPPGAEIFIDGKQQGATPLSLDLLKGSYNIVLQKDEYATFAFELKVPAGEKISPEKAVLTPSPATVELASKPPGASVMVDNVFQGRTPLNLSIGSREEHTLSLSLPDHESHTQTLLLAPGEKKNLVQVLQPQYGTVFIAAEPPDTDLYIDGKLHGKATGRIRLALREYAFEFRAPGYKTQTRAVRPKKEYSRQLEIRLEPEQGGLPPVGPPSPKTVGIGPEMILLPPAAFEMGSSGREPGRRANELLRQVRITRPFYVSAREVTNGEFRRFRPDHSSGVAAGFSLDGDPQPVVNVSWEDAVRYLNWLSRQDGLEPFYREENGRLVPVQPPTTGYRLPFESEWSYGARYAGTTAPARYPWPGSFPPPQHSGNFADESARGIMAITIGGYNDSFPVTAPVASFPKNMGGFFDIGGNVSEWCHDFYTPFISLSGQTAEDPSGPATGVHHVVRGSSWRDGSITELRLTHRSYSNRAQDDIGFRVARYAE